MNIDEMVQAQAKTEDYTKVETGGAFEKELPAKGACTVRFREYIEVGLRETATAIYPNKKPAVKARFVFELCSPKHEFTLGEGDDAKKARHRVVITLPKSKSEKSNYIKLFKMLNYKGKYKVPAQALGAAFKAEIFHVFDEKDLTDGLPSKDAKPKYANLNKGISYGDYSLEPPRVVDPITEEITEIPVPELLEDRKLFLWNMPTKECWDSLFIDGDRTVKENGVDVTKSNNWLQEFILDALDYEGSKLQELLVGAGENLDDLSTEPEETEQSDEMADILGA